MPPTADPTVAVELTLTDGRLIHVRSVIAKRVRGVDADGDPLVPLGETDNPIRDEDGEYLIPLTTCCQASGKGSGSGTGVVCRHCHQQVDAKYGGRGTLTAAVVTDTPGQRANGLTPLLVQRALATHATSTAPWASVEDALSVLREDTRPPTNVDRQTWLDGIDETLSLLRTATTVLLSPARHFLLIHSRVLRNRPLKWYVVHVATGVHLPQLGVLELQNSTSPQGAGMDLSEQAVMDYVNCVERLPGRHGGPVDWSAAATDLWAGLSRWQDPLAEHDGQDLDGPQRGSSRVSTAARQLHRAAVLHSLAADPAVDLTAETVQQVMLDLLVEALPPVYGRDPAGPAIHLRDFLRRLNGGRRRNRSDTRTPEACHGDTRTAAVVTLAALTAFGGDPRTAVHSLREHAARLPSEQDWYATADRVERLLHAALLIGELFSPEPTERQLLRHIKLGDVITILRPKPAPLRHPIDRVVQVIGPVQYLELGVVNGAEQFVIPVSDLTNQPPKPAMLVITPGKSFTLMMLDPRPWSNTVSIPAAALDRWAILPADAAGMTQDVLADRVRTASRRAADAFDKSDTATEPATTAPTSPQQPTN